MNRDGSYSKQDILDMDSFELIKWLADGGPEDIDDDLWDSLPEHVRKALSALLWSEFRSPLRVVYSWLAGWA